MDWNRVEGNWKEFVGYFEVADQVETARDSGIWQPNFTFEGIHEVQAGYLAIKNSGAINTAVIHRP